MTWGNVRTTSTCLLTVALVLGGASACNSKKTASSTTPTTAPGSAATTPAGSTAPTTAAAGATDPDPCSLLTSAAISTAMGLTIGAGATSQETGPLGGRKCYWSTPTTASQVSYFELTVRTAGDITNGQALDDVYAETVTAFTASDSLKAVAGIGDKAEIGKTQGLVRKGDFYLTTTIGLRTPNASTVLQTLTKAAVDAL